jgi:protein gp37
MRKDNSGQLVLFDEAAETPPVRQGKNPPKESSVVWNLWHGCTKYSAGCQNCYVYRGDSKRGIDSTMIHKTNSFTLPLKKTRDGLYAYPGGTTFYTCFTSDFLHPNCDEWRAEAWTMIKERGDCLFLFLTKRIERFMECIPADWGSGYDNVCVGATCETQKLADFRIPIFKQCPIKHKILIHEPILTAIDISRYLDNEIEEVVAGGESGPDARVCHYEWFVSLSEQCKKAGVSFTFKQTGARFIKDGKAYHIPRRLQHSQARKAGLNH